MKILSTPRMERCIGCYSCSVACARLVHKQLSRDKAGIRIRSTGALSKGFEAKPVYGLRSGALRHGFPHGGLFTALIDTWRKLLPERVELREDGHA